jgi:hypothetical protein
VFGFKAVASKCHNVLFIFRAGAVSCIAICQWSLPGWPDWANFRPLGVCLPWGSLLKITEVAQFFGYFFPRLGLCINLGRK